MSGAIQRRNPEMVELLSTDFPRRREIRTRLFGNRTYYVSTSGSDALNDGLSVSTPFLTVQKAVDVVSNELDLGGFSVTIQLADGTYNLTASITLRNYLSSSGVVSIVGNTTTPGNVVVNQTTSGQWGFEVSDNTRPWTIRGMRLTGTGSNGAAIGSTRGRVQFGEIEFGSGWSLHLYANQTGTLVQAVANYAVISGGTYHWLAEQQSLINAAGRTVTLTGTPAFTDWAACTNLGHISCFGMTFSGSASAGTRRYNISTNGVVNTNGGGAAYLPGGVAGVTATGGQYV